MSRIWDYTPLYEQNTNLLSNEIDNALSEVTECVDVMSAFDTIIESTYSYEVIEEASEKKENIFKRACGKIVAALKAFKEMVGRFIQRLKDKFKKNKSNDKKTSTEPAKGNESPKEPETKVEEPNVDDEPSSNREEPKRNEPPKEPEPKKSPEPKPEPPKEFEVDNMPNFSSISKFVDKLPYFKDLGMNACRPDTKTNEINKNAEFYKKIYGSDEPTKRGGDGSVYVSHHRMYRFLFSSIGSKFVNELGVPEKEKIRDSLFFKKTISSKDVSKLHRDAQNLLNRVFTGAIGAYQSLYKDIDTVIKYWESQVNEVKRKLNKHSRKVDDYFDSKIDGSLPRKERRELEKNLRKEDEACKKLEAKEKKLKGELTNTSNELAYIKGALFDVRNYFGCLNNMNTVILTNLKGFINTLTRYQFN